MSLNDRATYSLYDEDGMITGFAVIHPDHYDNTKHVPGHHDGKLNYFDIASQEVKPCNDNPATISHTGQVTQGTTVQITNLGAKSKVDISEVGLVMVDDEFLDIATDQALGEIQIKVRTPRYKPVEWTIEVVAP